VSGKILQFVPRPRRDRPLRETQAAFRSAPRSDDLVMDHADTAPCECIGPREEWRAGDEPA